MNRPLTNGYVSRNDSRFSVSNLKSHVSLVQCGRPDSSAIPRSQCLDFLVAYLSASKESLSSPLMRRRHTAKTHDVYDVALEDCNHGQIPVDEFVTLRIHATGASNCSRRVLETSRLGSSPVVSPPPARGWAISTPGFSSTRPGSL